MEGCLPFSTLKSTLTWLKFQHKISISTFSSSFSSLLFLSMNNANKSHSVKMFCKSSFGDSWCQDVQVTWPMFLGNGEGSKIRSWVQCHPLHGWDCNDWTYSLGPFTSKLFDMIKSEEVLGAIYYKITYQFYIVYTISRPFQHFIFRFHTSHVPSREKKKRKEKKGEQRERKENHC